MAVTSSSSPAKAPASAHNDKKRNRSKCPGVRLLGSRIYDSENGKTCHQCRQKTRDFTASCKNQKMSRQCPINFCHKCLLNRYGEKAEEVALLDKWICPKCRGVCNCSLCMKKRGHKPTGILVHAAKENGFSSVSEMLQIKGLDDLAHKETVKDKGVSPKKPASSKKGSIVTSPRKPGKENSFNGNSDLNLHSSNLTPISNDKNSKKKKRDGLKEVSNCGWVDDASLQKSGWKKPRISEEVSKDDVKTSGNDKGAFVEKKKSTTLSEKEEVKKNEKHEGVLGGKKKPKIHSEKVPKQVVKANGKDEVVFVEEKKSKEESEEVFEKEVRMNKKAKDTFVERKKFKVPVSKHLSIDPAGNEERDAADCKDVGDLNGVEDDNLVTYVKRTRVLYKIDKCSAELQNKQIDDDIQLPLGTCLATIASIELPPEGVGHALQFLEFCAAFGKTLNLKKGQAEAVLRQIINGRKGRRSQYSLVAQFHIQLLSLIEKDLGEKSPGLSPTSGKNSWLQALEQCVSKCQFMLKELPSGCFGGGNEGYEELDFSVKLKLLNFLCDEVLNTKDLRNWIDDQNSKFLEREKEAKEKVLAAKDKEKHLKQKIQDEVAKAIIAKNGAPFSVSEHEAIVSQIKSEAAQARVEMLEAMGMVPKKRQRSDAVRTDPILLDIINGHAFWRLNGYKSEPDILLQDMGTWNSVAPNEKWFFYDAEQKQEIEKYICSFRTKRLRLKKSPKTF